MSKTCNVSEISSAFAALYETSKLRTLVPLLPVLFSLEGRPLTLRRHFAMEFMYSANIPRKLVMKCARQVSKSTSLALSGLLLCSIKPYLAMLTVLPRYEQVRRFSSLVVHPLLSNSPIRKVLLSSKVEQSLLQRSFKNGSMHINSFAYLDAERIRGISAHWVNIDEAQDMDPSFIPVIMETMSGHDEQLERYSGTPKTTDNLLEKVWRQSSQAEWIIKCQACGRWNVCSVNYDLLQMIQPDGASCAKCGRIVNPESGHWYHFKPEKRRDAPGYHVPQVIMPTHYATRKWANLVEAKEKMPVHMFYNEKLGESYDTATALLTERDLRAASILSHNNEPKDAAKRIQSYVCRAIGIDWGGGGLDEVSYTTVAVLGFLPDGKTDVLFMDRLSRTLDPVQEVQIIMHYIKLFQCKFIAHDYGGGAGAVRETMLIQAGIPIKQILNFNYVRASMSDMVTYHPPTESNSRWYYSLDKARSLLIMIHLIKQGHTRFPRWESWGDSHAEDLLCLIEDKHKAPSGSDVFLVSSRASEPDDMSHSINFAQVAYWHHMGSYPDLIKKIGIRLSRKDMSAMNPTHPRFP